MMHGLTAGRGTSLFTQAHHRLPRAQWGPHHMHATSTRCQHQWAPLLPHTSRCTRTACKSRPRLNIMCQAKVAKLAGTQTPQPLVPYERILRALNNPSKQAPLPSPPTEATFRHVIPYLIRLALDEKNLLWRAAAAFCCLLASKAAGLLCPLMFKKAVDSFTLHAADPLPVVLKCASQCLLLYGLCDILKHVFKELQAPLFTPLSQAASRRVAYHTFSHVLGLDIRFHLDRRTGRLSRILERGTRSIQMLYRAVLFTFAPTALELLFVCGVLAKVFNPLVGLMVIATFTAYCSWSIIMTQVATDARKHVNELDNATSAKAVDALLSYETVTLFNNQTLEVGQYNVYLKQYMQAMVTTDRLAAVLNAGQSLILAVGLTGIMVTALYASGPNVSAGDMVMIQGLLLQLWAPLQFLGWFYRELRSALVDMDDFFGILRSESNIKDGTKPLPPVPAPYANMNGSSGHLAAANGVARNGNGGWNSLAGGLRQRTATHAGSNGSSYSDAWPSKAAVNGTHGGSRHSSSHDSSSNGIQQHSQQQGGPQSLLEQQALQAGAAEASQAAAAAQPAGLLVELEDVHFSYTPDRQILRGVSLRVEPGSSMALVGGSGSGKSTVLRLLTRLYDVNAGSVQLNGSDVRDITLETLRGAVAVVPQETTLFNDTIMQNIRYGRPTATDEEVIRAARMAHLDKAVERMPLGYNTMVGERGLKLSGGEKQRVAIARAFLRQPRLLICDEATSALDSETEKQIMASLDELARGRTSVFVAHRLSTVMNCDTIVVLSDGRVVEQGSHDVLMAKPGGVYRRMWELQAREDVEKAGRSKSRERNGGDEDSNGGAHKPSSLGDVPDGESDTSGSGSDSEREEGPEGREVVMQVAS